MRVGALGAVVTAALLASSCGGGGADTGARATGRAGTALIGTCPAVHLAYDSLIASDPASARAFEETVRRLRAAGDDETRAAIGPVVTAGSVLAAAHRASFASARDQVYEAIRALSATCATLGVPILH